MKKRNIFIVLFVIIALSVFVVLANILLFMNKTNDLQSIKKGEFMCSVDSPNGSYTVNLYLQNGGATTSWGVLGELICVSDGTSRNIYYEYRTNSANCKWVDEHTVIINDRQLDVRHDTYDWTQNNTDDIGPFEYWRSMVEVIINDFLIIFK